jgi:hypothetical protein
MCLLFADVTSICGILVLLSPSLSVLLEFGINKIWWFFHKQEPILNIYTCKGRSKFVMSWLLLNDKIKREVFFKSKIEREVFIEWNSLWSKFNVLLASKEKLFHILFKSDIKKNRTLEKVKNYNIIFLIRNYC